MAVVTVKQIYINTKQFKTIQYRHKLNKVHVSLQNRPFFGSSRVTDVTNGLLLSKIVNATIS